MQLIKILGKRLAKSGKRNEIWAVFLCSFDNRLIEKRLYQGLRDLSCGCQFHSEEHNKKIGLSNKGKKMPKEAVEKTKLTKIGKRQTEEHKQKIRESLIGKNIGKVRTEETRQKISNSLKGRFLGENSSNWNNGSSFLPYAPEFNKELKSKIKQRDFHICQTPNCMNTENLHIHHIDYDKKNNSLDNLTTLCNSCHGKTNGKNNRIYWIKYYQELLTIYL